MVDGSTASFANDSDSILSVTYVERNRSAGYSYDEAGNRRTETIAETVGSPVSKSYEQWTGTDRIRNDGKYGYRYDGDGNLIEKGTHYTIIPNGDLSFSTTAGEYWSYRYDLWNRMVEVRKGAKGSASATSVASYTYDPESLRIRKSTASASYRYWFGVDGNVVADERTAGGQKRLRTYVYAAGALVGYDEKIGTTTKRYYTCTDQLGSVTAETDSSGAVVGRREYTDFGKAGLSVSVSASHEALAWYANREYDPDVELVYMNHRWYDQDTGTFTTEDPIQEGPGKAAFARIAKLDGLAGAVDQRSGGASALGRGSAGKVGSLAAAASGVSAAVPHFSGIMVGSWVRRMEGDENWYSYCRSNGMTSADPTGLLSDSALAGQENKQYRSDFVDSDAYRDNLRKENVQDELEHPERSHEREESYTPADFIEVRPRNPLPQIMLPNTKTGKNAQCYVRALLFLAELQSGLNYTPYELLRLQRAMVGRNASEDGDVYRPQAIAQAGFDLLAGGQKVVLNQSPIDAQASVLENWNVTPIDDGGSVGRRYRMDTHFQIGTGDLGLAFDPWGRDLTSNYSIQGIERFYVHW